MTPDLLVQAVRQLQSTNPIVTSRMLKDWLDRRGVPWGRAHGWPIRRAEDGEFAEARPRLVKWKCGHHQTAMVGYSLSSSAAVGAARQWARRNGWHQRRP